MNQTDFQENTHPQEDNTLNEGPEYATPAYPYQDMMAFTPTQFTPDFMAANNFDGMNYQVFPNQYMSMPYGYFSYPYNYGDYYGKKPYNPHKKKFHGYTTTQRVYMKKPKQPSQVNVTPSTDGDSEHSTKEITRTPDVEKLPHHIEKAKFFVIKSYSEEDVHKAIKHNLWCSTKEGNVKLHDAYVAAEPDCPIYLLFSVNSSGHFVGVAQMKSHVDFDQNFGGWNQTHKWKGVFKISWIYIKDIPNKELRHLKNDFNEGKPVPNSRDCQEVPFDVGLQVLEIFEKYKNQTSILDDYDYYELQERVGV